MIVFNNTIKVHHSIQTQWLQWMIEEHIPDILRTGLFDDYKMYHLTEQDDEEGVTYAIQYFTTTRDRYQQYLDKFAGNLQQKAFNKWGNLFIGFQTVMRLVN